MKNLEKLALISVLIFSLNCPAQTESSSSGSSSEQDYSEEFVVKEKLGEAISREDIKRVEEILKSGANSNTQISETGETAIMVAVAQENKEMVKILIKYGADPNQGFNEVSGDNALLSAVNDFEMAKLLIEAGADINYADRYGATALTYAREVKNQELINLLTQKGAKEGNKHWDIFEFLYSAYSNSEENIKKFKAMIKGKEEANSYNGHQTVIAVIMSDIIADEKKAELLDFLISKGADINFQDKEGRTLLMDFIIYAGYEGLENFKLLISKGADHKIKDNEGQTALDYALEKDNDEIAEFLKTLK